MPNAIVPLVLSLAACSTAAAQWTNLGGNAGRNGQSSSTGPAAPTPVWSTAPRSSIIAWAPCIEARRVFTVRQTGFPPEPGSNLSPIVAIDLDTGQELWSRNIPFVSGDWTTWVGGVRNGRVYASRGGNGASAAAPLYCLDATNGNELWHTQEEIDSGAYDGVVFAPDGDPIIASFRFIWRFDAVTGARVWRTARLCSVSGNCGAAARLSGDGGAVYIADAVAGGHTIKRFDITTGAFEYQSPVMPGFTLQNNPMVSPDGTIYLSRSQNNAPVDSFYAINDSGSAMTIRWSTPCQWSTESEFGVGPDNSVYMFAPGNILQRRDPADGHVLQALDGPIAADFLQPHFAIDAAGKVFLSNGAFSNGRLFAFSPDLTPLWNVPVPNINIGGPALAADGTLVVCGIGNDMRAYRTTFCPADFNHDGSVDFFDYDAFVICFEGGACPPGTTADFDGDGTVDFFDYDAFVVAFETPC